MAGSDFATLNENGLRDVLMDVQYVESEMKRLGKTGLGDAFEEIYSVPSLFLTLSHFLFNFVRLMTTPLCLKIDVESNLFGFSADVRPEPQVPAGVPDGEPPTTSGHPP